MPSTSTPGTHRRSRARRLIAGSVAAGLAVTGLTVATSQSANAATTPLAQSVGRFLDGSLGGNPIQQLADVADARAVAPGSQSAQNPLDATLLNSLELPLTGALQLPSLAGITLGAANQVAVAQNTGFSYGASGLVNNSGGVSVGGNNAAFPADATIDLSAAALGGGTIPIPGGSAASALGGLKLKLGAVSALAQTPTGVAKPGATNYNIAGLSLELGSPALGQLLSTLTGALNPTGVLSTITGLLGNLAPLPQGCALSQGQLPTSLDLAGGAVVINAANATITVNVAALLQTLGLNLNSLPANTDLLSYVLNYLTSVDGLAKGLQSLIGGLVTTLTDQYDACKSALQAIPVLGPVITQLVDALVAGQTTLTNAVNGLLGSLSGLAGGAGNPLAPIGTALANVISIGVNVQPNGATGTFASKLKATPNQATGVVAGQTIVRAIEIDLLGGQVAALALANAAAGPSSAAPTTPPTSAPPTTGAPNTELPTKINAGEVTGGGSPTMPLVLLALGLCMAAGGAVAWKVRGRHVL